jgi:hypothetical protein
MTESEFYEAFKAFFPVYPIDRTGYFSNSSVIPFTTLHPIPAKDPLLTNDISVLINRRANELKNSLAGKTIYLMWSGGIDSTTAFYALVAANVEFTVLMSDTSYREYPALAAKITTNSIPGVSWSDIFTTIPTIDFANSVIVTGEGGDQCLGSHMFSKMDYETRVSPYKDYIPADFLTYTDPIVSQVVDNLETCTAGQYVWAINFTLKYAKALSRIKNHFGGLETASYEHFYDTDYFQQWAMNNSLANSSFLEFSKYKQPLKDYIFAANGDDAYRTHKTKVPSLRFKRSDNELIIRSKALQELVAKNSSEGNN